MSAYVSPVLRRRQLALRLKRARLARDLSVEDASTRAGFSGPKLSRLELAERGAQLKDVQKLADVYSVPVAERDEWLTMALEAQQKGWWQSYRTIRPETALYFGLEDAATRIRWFEASRMPGLLHTPRYARLTVEEHVRGMKVPSEMVVAQGEIPVRRARRLSEEPVVDLDVIIDEAVISRRIGSPEVMAEQIDHMIDLTLRQNVSIRVVPFSVGSYPGTEGSFTLLDFDAEDEVPMSIWVEDHVGTFLLNKSLSRQQYQELWVSIARRASGHEETLAILRKAASTWRSLSVTAPPTS